MKKLSYAITGANGFVGSAIAGFLRNKKYEIFEIGRQPSKDIQGKQCFIPYSLGESIDEKKLGSISVFIHCAYDFSLASWEDIQRININGSIKLLKDAHNAGIKKIIFVSTLCAFESCKSMYGKAKLAVEKEAAKLGAIIVRPNLVFGKDAGGSIGSLNRQISLSRFVPVIGSASQVHFLCHKDDLASLVWKLSIAEKIFDEPVIAVSEKGFLFKDILKILASAERKKICIIPVPYWMAYSALRFLEIIKINIGLRSDSLVSMVNVNQDIDFEPARRLGQKFREFNAETANQ